MNSSNRLRQFVRHESAKPNITFNFPVTIHGVCYVCSSYYTYNIYIYTCVCVYVCKYTYLHVEFANWYCMYVCMYACMYLSIYVFIYLSIYTSNYLSMYVCITYLCICVMYLCMYVSMSVCRPLFAYCKYLQTQSTRTKVKRQTYQMNGPKARNHQKTHLPSN